MTTSQNSEIVAQLPALPEGFAWSVRTGASSVDPSKLRTTLWLEAVSDGALSGNSNDSIINWQILARKGKLIQDPTIEDFTVVAESMLAKTSTRASLGLIAPLQ